MKRILSFLLASGLIAGMTACGGTGGSAGAPPASGGSEASGSGGPVTLSIFIDHSWYPVESFTGIIPEEITKQTRVTLDPTIAIDANQLGVMMGSGELPDLVYTQNMIDRMSDPNLAYSYEELLGQYDTGWEPSAKQLGIARTFSKDGKAYTILNHYSEKADWEGVSSVPMVGSLTYRQDLWKAIGSPKMESLDDLFSVMGQIKAAYPDVVPLQLNANWNTLVFRNLIGMGALEYIEQDDGSYIHYTRDERYKKLLLWLNDCYRSGYISTDDAYFVTGSTAIAVDKYFFSCVSTQNSLPSINADIAAINPDYISAELVPFKDSSYLTSDLGWSATFITKNNKAPEASIKFIAWMFTPEAQALTQMGREGTEYTLSDKGLPEFSDEWKQSIADGTQDTKYNTWFYLGGSVIVEANSRCATTDPALVEDAYTAIRERFDNLPWITAAVPKTGSDEKVILDKIVELAKTYEAKVILADSPELAEAAYNEYLTYADQTGIKQLEQYVSDKVKETMPLFK